MNVAVTATGTVHRLTCMDCTWSGNEQKHGLGHVEYTGHMVLETSIETSIIHRPLEVPDHA